jgi:hypothetical protein
MLIVAFGFMIAAAVTIAAASDKIYYWRRARYDDRSQKTFEPIDEPPQVRRICGYLDGGNLWKK